MNTPLNVSVSWYLGVSLALGTLFTAFTTLACAQAISGTVVGTVHDSSGAVVSGATVTATNIDTNIGQSTVANGDGDYTIPNLSPGAYKLTAQYKGFASAVVPSITVRVEQATRVEFTLSPGETTQQVVVTAEAPLVSSTTSDLGHVVE